MARLSVIFFVSIVVVLSFPGVWSRSTSYEKSAVAKMPNDFHSRFNGEVLNFNGNVLTAVERPICLVSWFSGRCEVTKCSSAQRARIGIIPESGTSISKSPRNDKIKKCDGFVFKGFCKSRWFKVGNHCKAVYNCKTRRFSTCCRFINILTHGKPSWESSRKHKYKCPSGWWGFYVRFLQCFRWSLL